MLTRGPLVYIATFEYLEEGLEYISERVDIILLVFIVTVFHFLLKYFLINLWVASFLHQFSETRKDIEQKRQLKRITREKQKLKELQSKRIDVEEEEKEKN